jgi:glycosyltransferase involved in cell wall biosynthesis
VTSFVHLIHSLDPQGGGVSEAVVRLDSEFNKCVEKSSIVSNRLSIPEKCSAVLAHGLWQWPSYLAWKNYKKNGTPYLVFPHGMLDPWFKKTYPLKHIKKQVYWWYRQGTILRDAYAVCFTTEEERLLARKTFSPYQCNELVTGLGVGDPPGDSGEQGTLLYSQFPQLKNKRVLLYLGRFHPKKGVDLLINAFVKYSNDDDMLVLAGPNKSQDSYLKTLQELTAKKEKQILWTGMLEGDLKWGVLRVADALILPSHQENFGMVIAEALSVGTPVFLTNKVNLWREVVNFGAGIVSNDHQEGILELVHKWSRGEHVQLVENTVPCFREKFNISKTAENIMSLFSKND